MQEEGELTWTEKFNLIEQELRTNPARSDGLISRTLGTVSKASVYRVREALVAEGKVRNVPIPERMAATGTKVRNNGARSGAYAGNRIAVPAGKTVFDVVKEAIAVEEDGIAMEDAARLIGIGRASYTQARAIILLSERTDLSASEAALVKEAVDEMNETRRTAIPYQKLGSLIERVWGGRGLARNRKGALKRSASFSHAMTIVIDACMAAPDIHVPLLSDEERASAVQQLDEAVASLRKLKRKVVEGRWK